VTTWLQLVSAKSPVKACSGVCSIVCCPFYVIAHFCTVAAANDVVGNWCLVNQDTLGSRPACEAVAHSALQAGLPVVIDRCQNSIADTMMHSASY
jgi:hypothetical protein